MTSYTLLNPAVRDPGRLDINIGDMADGQFLYLNAEDGNHLKNETFAGALQHPSFNTVQYPSVPIVQPYTAHLHDLNGDGMQAAWVNVAPAVE